MVGSEEKGFAKIKLKLAGAEKHGKQGKDRNLKFLPKYIVYRAALLREKLVMSYAVLVISALFGLYFVISRIEIFNLYEKLRVKEYILAPGVQDFTTATPQSVSDSYVYDAVRDFLSTLGNVNAANIEEQYAALKRFMSDSLKVQFEADTREWINQVKAENLAQILKSSEIKIVSNQNGSYKATAFGRADYYAASEYLGHEDQVIEIELTLVPPERDKRWYLQISRLVWSKLESFQTKRKIENPTHNKE